MAISKDKKRIIVSFILLFSDIILMFLFHNYPDLFFPWYRNISKIYLNILSAVTGFLPFSIWDIAALLLFILFIFFLIRSIRKTKLLSYICTLVLIISILFTDALFGWLLNHYAPPLNEIINLQTRQYTVEELYDATDYYLKKACEYAPLTFRENSHVIIRDFNELAIEAGKSYKDISATYPIFKGSNSRVKSFSLIGDYLMYNGIIGMFMPLTGEASVPYHVPPVVMPFTMAHEASHRLGIASEQEANFSAFLACINNTDPVFIYSGYYSAFSYCFSSLYQNDPELAISLYKECNYDNFNLLINDRKDTAAIYQKYESSLKEISDQINDTYLKTFSQESGIASYGEVTEYLIAYYFNAK